MLTYNKTLTPFARELRQNMTDAEKCLWSRVRMRQLNGCQFYRQRIIGDYIVDFFCPKARLIVEVDGSQHLSGDIVAADSKRDQYMEAQGLKVLRFTDTDVLKNIDGVLTNIVENMGEC